MSNIALKMGKKWVNYSVSDVVKLNFWYGVEYMRQASKPGQAEKGNWDQIVQQQLAAI